MERFPIYRTEKGNLTLNPNGNPVYVVKSKSLEGAKEMLAMLKAAEKNNK